MDSTTSKICSERGCGTLPAVPYRSDLLKGENITSGDVRMWWWWWGGGWGGGKERGGSNPPVAIAFSAILEEHDYAPTPPTGVGRVYPMPQRRIVLTNLAS